jgi:hypothetical protein
MLIGQAAHRRLMLFAQAAHRCLMLFAPAAHRCLMLFAPAAHRRPQSASLSMLSGTCAEKSPTNCWIVLVKCRVLIRHVPSCFS